MLQCFNLGKFLFSYSGKQFTLSRPICQLEHSSSANGCKDKALINIWKHHHLYIYTFNSMNLNDSSSLLLGALCSMMLWWWSPAMVWVFRHGHSSNLALRNNLGVQIPQKDTRKFFCPSFTRGDNCAPELGVRGSPAN